MMTGLLTIDRETKYIQEPPEVVVCYNCHGFGHVRIWQARQTCKHCGRNHDVLGCREEQQYCLNCRIFGIAPEHRRHSPRDRECPVHTRHEQRLKEAQRVTTKKETRVNASTTEQNGRQAARTKGEDDRARKEEEWRNIVQKTR